MKNYEVRIVKKSGAPVPGKINENNYLNFLQKVAKDCIVRVKTSDEIPPVMYKAIVMHNEKIQPTEPFKIFTEKQLDLLEQLHYLHSKLWRKGKNGGITEEENEKYDKLQEECSKFLPFS